MPAKEKFVSEGRRRKAGRREDAGVPRRSQRVSVLVPTWEQSCGLIRSHGGEEGNSEESHSGLEVLEKVKQWRRASEKAGLCLLKPGEMKSRREHKGRSGLRGQRGRALGHWDGEQKPLGKMWLVSKV